MGSTPATTLIDTFGVASCLGGSHDTCQTAPYVIRSSPFESILTNNHLALHWKHMVTPRNNMPNSLNCLSCLSKEIASLTHQHTLEHFFEHKTLHPFLLISGDHSSAIGTWSGVMRALARHNKKLGLIWLDAHLDAHTLDTSPSGNLHGMPLSVLLGKSDKALQASWPNSPTNQQTKSDYLLGHNLTFLGVRSYEPEELTLLNSVNATIHTMETLENSSSPEQLLNTITRDLLTRCDIIGISLDLDAISPEDAPAVETPELNGISGNLLISMLKNFSYQEKLAGFEISEFNPVNDEQQKTERLVMQLICAMFEK